MIISVKRLVGTAFIVLYTLMLLWSSVDRTWNWAARQSEAISRQDPSNDVSIAKPRPPSPARQVQRRIIENPFVVEPPLLASWIALTPQALQQRDELLVTGLGSPSLSGRSPPRI